MEDTDSLVLTRENKEEDDGPQRIEIAELQSKLLEHLRDKYSETLAKSFAHKIVSTLNKYFREAFENTGVEARYVSPPGEKEVWLGPGSIDLIRESDSWRNLQSKASSAGGAAAMVSGSIGEEMFAHLKAAVNDICPQPKQDQQSA